MYVETLYKLYKDFNRVYDEIKQADSLEEVFNVLLTIDKVGPFYAYEIVCDLVMKGIIPFRLDDWVNCGPGCKTGLDLIFPNRNYIGYDKALHWLRNNQRRFFKKLGLSFPYWKGKELSLRNIEHSLCEFSKYWKLKRGLGRYRLKFVPVTKIKGVK